MRRGKSLRRRLAVLVLGVVVGCAAGVASVTLGEPPRRSRTGIAQRAVFDATHLPPLLTMPDERAELAYDVHCAAGDDEEPRLAATSAAPSSSAGPERGSFERLALSARESGGSGRQLAARVPELALLAARRLRVLRGARGTRARRAASPSRPEAPTRRMRPVHSRTAVDVALGRHAFGDAPRG